MLIQTGSVNILTDPIWSLRAGPVSWMGVRRVRAPGVRMKDLPTIHYVLLSHDHYDHLDLPTLKTLTRRDAPLILTGLGVKKVLSRHGMKKVLELDWWQGIRVRGASVSFELVPARHGSGRLPLCSDRTLWGGFIIDGPAGRIYYAGDTAWGPFLEKIHQRWGSISDPAHGAGACTSSMYPGGLDLSHIY